MRWLHGHTCIARVGVHPVEGEVKDVQGNRKYFSGIENTAEKSSDESCPQFPFIDVRIENRTLLTAYWGAFLKKLMPNIPQ